ncbi:putative small ubiquitin-related modifier 8 [Rutidosis leptorrhynchoides]|uniref:putative small ubiquitin-related modifier 8 n=1 Tax=Rutidosis leptorrhynchoides TaxID=125765 RepID=UPI003A99D710
MSSPTTIVKQEPKNEDSLINIKVLSNLNQLDPYFRVKRDDPMQQLMIKWAVRADVKDYTTIRFLYEGKRIKETDTADQIGIENDDSIDAMTEQIGGQSNIDVPSY